MKPRNIPLDPSPDFPLTLGLVSGEIGSATLQIPWTSPKSGNTILEIDEFHIILRLRVKEPDPSRSYEDILQDQKMVILRLVGYHSNRRNLMKKNNDLLVESSPVIPPHHGRIHS